VRQVGFSTRLITNGPESVSAGLTIRVSREGDGAISLSFRRSLTATCRGSIELRKGVVLVVAVLAAAVGVLVSCSSRSSPSGPRLVAEGTGGGGEVFPKTRPGVAYVVMLRSVCTTGSPITVTRVVAAQPTGGVRVTSWGIRLIGPRSRTGVVVPDHGDVSQMPGFTHRRVTVRCNAQAADRVAVSVSRKDLARGTMRGVWMYYANGQRVWSQFGFASCQHSPCPPPPNS
jgi:hypothetical protein